MRGRLERRLESSFGGQQLRLVLGDPFIEEEICNLELFAALLQAPVDHCLDEKGPVGNALCKVVLFFELSVSLDDGLSCVLQDIIEVCHS